MTSTTGHKLTVLSLSLNAILLAVLIGLMSRGSTLPSAIAAPVFSSDSTDLIVSTGQMSVNTWGCYVLEKSSGVLCAYQYIPAEKLLRLQAARQITQDFGLKDFNTDPHPSQVEDLVQQERTVRAGAVAPSGAK